MAYLIQITDPGIVNDKWFLHAHQFTYEDTSTRLTEVKCCGGKTTDKWLKCYRVVIDDVDYHIPSTMAVETTRELTEEEQNVQKTWLKDAVTDELTDDDGLTDYVKGAREYLDRDIAAKDRSDQADYADEGYLDDIKESQDPPTTRGEEVSQ